MKCLMGAYEEGESMDMEERGRRCRGAVLREGEKVLVNGFGEMQKDGTLLVTHLSLLHEECAGWWQGEAALATLGPVLRENALGYIRVVEEMDPIPVSSKNEITRPHTQPVARGVNESLAEEI